MLKYNNTHIFTGYLKQLLSSFQLPACKIYTHEFARYLAQHGEEDPRVLESFDTLVNETKEVLRPAVRINYLKNNELYNYFVNNDKASWKRCNGAYYDSSSRKLGITKTLYSPGNVYDTKTHEYLGDYLRFLRDYHNINLMSLYNCFNNKVYNNIYFNFTINPSAKENQIEATFNAQDSGYRIYAVPVKLFADYTIAVDSSFGIELFCGLYNTKLDVSSKAAELAARTYRKINKTLFNQPFLYNNLTISSWPIEQDFNKGEVRSDVYTHWDLTSREKDLKLFIKVPASCESTITILEGDFRSFNNTKYFPEKEQSAWHYQQNHSVLNFNTMEDKVDLNNYDFKPVSKLQLLALNTRESYPFADRLIEFLGGSTINPLDEIPDNIKRVQRVMRENGYYFKIEGLWENKMQNILYDYMINSGPHNKPGHTTKSTQYDILGYVDKDTEKLYASWKKVDGKPKVSSSLQSIDIYDGLYDI